MPESPGKPCPECGGRGWIVAPDGGSGAARPCVCRSGTLAARRLSGAGIPERYARCRLANFLVSSPVAGERVQLSRALQAAQGYVDNFLTADLAGGSGGFRESGLLFLGPPGTGKTHLAVAEFTSLLYQIQATFDPGSPESKHAVLDPLLDAELLVLDELGAQQPTPWVRDVLYYVVNQRYLRRLPTIFTTNYRLERAVQRPTPVRGNDRSLDRGRDAAPDLGETDNITMLASRISAPLVSRLYEMAQPVDLSAVSDFRRDHKAYGARV
jgi:DNA replication protein DnaC